MSTQSHFFIESGGFPEQTGAQSFGPVSDGEFKLTSKFTLSGAKKAFSICKGVVLVQPQAGSTTKVNLILRPYNQPFSGLNIKYFIYRGLQRSDFFNEDSTLIIEETSGTSDFINKINQDFDAFNEGREDEEGEPIDPPPFTPKFIGYDPTVADSKLLSGFFFKESEFVEAGETFDETDNFELPLIDIGKSLGSFASGDCGIDVVLNYGDYNHSSDKGEFIFDLAYARATEARITLSGTNVEKKLQREQITQFIDITAFYGLFVNEGKVKVSDATGETSSKSGNAIYNDLLSNFFNRNTVYLYIQSNLKRSYNFYNNYQLSGTNSDNLKFGIPDNLAEDTYGYLDWPVHVFDIEQEGNSTDFNDISIQLVSSSSYEEIALYVALGNGDSDRGFITRENIIDPLNTSEDVNFSKVINFKVPNVDVSGEKKHISSLIQIIYIGKDVDFSPLGEGALWDDKNRYSLYNNLFPNVDIVPNFANNNNLLVGTVNKLSLINYGVFSNLMNESVLQDYVVFQKGIKNVIQLDLSTETFTNEKVLFISKKIETLDSFSIHDSQVLSKIHNSSNMSISPKETDHSSYFTTLYGSKDYSLTHTVITDDATDIKLLSLGIGESYDYCFYNLGITKNELDTLKGLIPTKATNINIYIHDDLNNPHVDNTSATSYFKYSLGISFESIDGELSVLLPTVPIYVYGHSNKFLASAEYSDFEEKSLSDNNITLIKEI
jgi:hypothetical protein